LGIIKKDPACEPFHNATRADPAISESNLRAWAIASFASAATSTSESSALVASSRSRIGASLQHHARDRDALALAAGEFHPALADVRVAAVAPLGINKLRWAEKYKTLQLRCVTESARVVSDRMQLVRVIRKGHAMVKSKSVALASLVGVALALAPLSSAFADNRFHGHWDRGGHWGGGHGNVGYSVHGGHGYGGHGCYGCFWPLGLAAAVVGTAAAVVVNTAAAVVTAPFVALDAAARASYYAPPQAYAAPPARYDDAPPAYYNAPAAPSHYAPPARYYYNSQPAAQGYYGPPAAPAYYRAPAAPAYYAPPARSYARPADSAYYVPRPPQYRPPPDYYGQASTAPPGYAYDSQASTAPPGYSYDSPR